jgi:hypothetical protein
MDTDPATNKPILKTGYDKEKAIRPYVQTTLFIENEPTEQGLSFGAQLGYTTKQLQEPAIQEKLINHYTDRLYSALTGGTKFDKDSGNNEIQQQKLAQKTANDAAKLGQGQQKINQKEKEMQGKGYVEKPFSITDYEKMPNTAGGFNVKNNALTVTYGEGKSKIQQKVTGIYIDPKNPKKVKINYIETGQKPDVFGTAQPYSEKKTFDSATDEEMAGTFPAQIGKTIEELHKELMKKVPRPKAKPKANKEELRNKYKY